MALPSFPDPFELGREAINRLEAGANSLANRKLTNAQGLAKTLAGIATTSLGLRRVLEKVLAGAFARLDIPSRGEIAALAVAVQRIEDKLDLLLRASDGSSAARRLATPAAASARWMRMRCSGIV